MRIASLKSLVLWIVIGVIIIALIASFYPFAARANIYHLYANACLGGWENTHLATGLPQAFKKGEEPALTGDNSARLNAGTLARIYCGGFTGDILEHTIPQKIRVRLSLAIEYTGLQNIETPVFNGEPAIVTEITENVIQKDSIPTETITPNQKPSPQEEPQEEPQVILEAPEAAPLVLYSYITEQTVSPISPEVITTTSETATIENKEVIPNRNPFEIIPHIEKTDSTENEIIPLTTPASEQIESKATPAPEISYGLLEVTYTLDGIEWKRLGFVRANEFHNKYFEIPIEEASDWKDISKIQISVQGVPTLDSIAPTIYLDAIWLEVEYKKSLEDQLKKDPLPPPGSLEGDIIISRTLHEQMTAVLVSRKSGPLPGDTKNELWIASASPDADIPFMTEWQLVAEDAILSDNPRITFSDGNLFWVGKNDENAWRFNPSSGGYESISRNPGEPIELFFDDRSGEPHKLQVSPEGVLEILEIIEVSDEQIIVE